MHTLLACTALHMAYLDLNQQLKLTIQARIHPDHAIPLFGAAIQSVGIKTCDAVLIFARLVAITAFALDERFLIVKEAEDKLLSWLFFIRSGYKLLIFRSTSVLLMRAQELWNGYL